MRNFKLTCGALLVCVAMAAWGVLAPAQVNNPGGSTGANPTATAGPTAVNGSATTFMRSDAAPAVQSGTNAVQGIVKCDTTTINCSGGTITTAALPGLTGGSNPAAGLVGEFVSSSLAPGSAIALSTSGTIVTVTSISLTAGNWDISGVCAIVPLNTTLTSAIGCATNTVAATFPADASTGHAATGRFGAWTGNGVAYQSLDAPVWHVNPTTTTTYYLVGNTTFATSTSAIYGYMRAIRTP